MTTLAIIPARNEARTIRSIARTARQYVDRVIVVDDGSDDQTVRQLDGLDVFVVRRAQAGGKAAALADGFDHALKTDARLVVTLDGDGQHDAADIGRLLDAARAFPGHLVLGARVRQRHRQPGLRKFGNRFADFFISWASAQRVPDSQTGFRVYPRALLSTVRPSTDPRHGFVFETAMLIDGARAGHPCVAVGIDSVYADDARPSFFRPGKDVWEIFRFVAGRILVRAFYPLGLWKVLMQPVRFHDDGGGGDESGYEKQRD